jgi:hypothetical protein
VVLAEKKYFDYVHRLSCSFLGFVLSSGARPRAIGVRFSQALASLRTAAPTMKFATSIEDWEIDEVRLVKSFRRAIVGCVFG